MMDSDESTKPNSSKNNKNRGRGTSRDEILKEQRARDFFVMGMDAEFTWRQPGTPGRQKCFSLWKKWSQELLDTYNLKINDRQVIANQKNVLSFRRLLFKLEYQLNKFFNLTEEHRDNWKMQVRKAEMRGEEPPRYEPRMEWEYFIRKLITDIVELRDGITSTEYALTIGETDEASILKYLEELQERRYKIKQEHEEKIRKMREDFRKQEKQEIQ